MTDLRESDVDRSYYKGSGPGGQNRNRRFTGVRLVHRPTGLKVEICVERTRGQNERLAWEELGRRLDGLGDSIVAAQKKRSHDAKPAASHGQWRRTYFLDRDRRVVDRLTGESSTDAAGVLNGGIERFLLANLERGQK